MEDGFHWVKLVVVLAFVVGAAVGVWLYVRKDAREFKAAKDGARLRGLEYLGNSLPPDLPATLLDVLPDSLNVSNCVSGYRRGERVVGFDYAAGRGKASMAGIAMRRRHAEKPVTVPEKFAMNQVDDWTLLYTPGWLGFRVGQELVEELWAGLHTVSVAEGEAVQKSVRSESGLHIAPRHGR